MTPQNERKSTTILAILAILAALAGIPACETGTEGSDLAMYEWEYDIWAEPTSIERGLEDPFEVIFYASFEGEVAPTVATMVEFPSYLSGPEIMEETDVSLSVVDPGDADIGDPMVYSYEPALGQQCSHTIELTCREAGAGESIVSTYELDHYADTGSVSIPVVCTDGGSAGGACEPASASWEPDPYGEGYFYVTLRYDADDCSCSAEDGWDYGTTLTFRKTPGESYIYIGGLDIQILETSVGEVGVTGSGINYVPLGTEVTFTVYDENLDRTFTITAIADEANGITVSSISDCS